MEKKSTTRSKDIHTVVSPSRSRQTTRKTETENVPIQVCDDIFLVFASNGTAKDAVYNSTRCEFYAKLTSYSNIAFFSVNT